MATDLLERTPLRAPARAGARAAWSARRRERAAAAAARAAAERAQALAGVAACLDRAAALLERGWAQDGWWVVDRRAPAHLVSPPVPSAVVATCLVGAVVQAAGRGPGSGSVVRRTVDVLWEVRQEVRQQVPQRVPRRVPQRAAPSGLLPGFRRVCSPQERAGRVHDLVRWNDAPSRTRAEVLGLVEAARCRALAAARE